MKTSLALTGTDLARAIAEVARLPAVDAALRERADTLAADLAGNGIVTRVLRRETGDYAVSVEGPNLFAREFGSVNRPAEPAIADAIARLKR
jgi:hypothetical protein